MKKNKMEKINQEQINLLNHKLKGPLTTLNLYTEALLTSNSENLSEQQKDYINEISKASKKMINNINELLKK